MIVTPPYWFWKSELPDSVCDAIIAEGLKLDLKEAVVGYGGDSRVDPNIRKSKTGFFLASSWVSAITTMYMSRANESAWKFGITQPQAPQFTMYGLNEFYDFHRDETQYDYITEDSIQKDFRKLSVVIFITDPNEYEGGEFEFDGFTPEIKDRGSIMVFPSFLNHRVKPVTKGTRYSIVNWFVGPPFR